MLVSCGAEGSIAVTQRFFCEFRFRFRVSAWRFKNQFEVALLSSAACCSKLGGVSWEKYMHIQSTITEFHKARACKMYSKWAKEVQILSPRFTAKQASPFQCLGDHVTCKDHTEPAVSMAWAPFSLLPSDLYRSRTDFLSMSHGVVWSRGVVESWSGRVVGFCIFCSDDRSGLCSLSFVVELWLTMTACCDSIYWVAQAFGSSSTLENQRH